MHNSIIIFEKPEGNFLRALKILPDMLMGLRINCISRAKDLQIIKR